MNTYHKFVPNVFLAKCSEPHEKGEVIIVTTRHQKENESIVFNLILEKDGFYYYSIVRADGFNVQKHAERKATRLQGAASNAQKKSDEHYTASNEHSDFLSLGEPIKVGHHSEKGHRNIVEKANNNMRKSVEFSKKSESLENRAEYWKSRTDTINLSMPESIEFYEFKLAEATATHLGLKDGTIERTHSFSLTYAKKDVNDLTKKLELAKRLWE